MRPFFKRSKEWLSLDRRRFSCKLSTRRKYFYGVKSRFLSQKGTSPNVFRNGKFFIYPVGKILLSRRERSFKFRFSIGRKLYRDKLLSGSFSAALQPFSCVSSRPQIGNNGFYCIFCFKVKWYVSQFIMISKHEHAFQQVICRHPTKLNLALGTSLSN